MAKNTFKKLLKGRDVSQCWYCQKPTQYALYFPDFSEVWACSICLGKHGKIRRFKRLPLLRPAELKSLKISANSPLNSDKKLKGERQQSLSFAVASNSLNLEEKHEKYK